MIENIIFILGAVNIVVVSVLSVFYLPQALHILRSFFPPKKYKDANENHHYCFLIPAKNEGKVIAGLIDSIKKQNYPSELLDIFVIADNCTDNTKEIAENMGAVVFERNDMSTIGKGYGLKLGLKTILNDYAHKNYKGIFFFDADNLLDKNYVQEMNKAVDSGETLLTSYRNAKNFGESWSASCSGLIFARENRIIHTGRTFIGASTFVAGTGFYADINIFKESDGWNWFLLTEDLEFSFSQIFKNRKIAFVYDAIFYDEQPKSFMDTWHQRKRWLKGADECFKKDRKRLFKGLFSKRFASCVEGLAFSGPWPFFITIWTVLYHLTTLGLTLSVFNSTPYFLYAYLIMLACIIVGYNIAGILFASYLLYMERQRIKGKFIKKLTAVLMFPLFVFSFIPIVFAAKFSKRQWKTIEHSYVASISEIDAQQ